MLANTDFFYFAVGTTDTQAASITFFENNVFLTCDFASNSNALGCEFQLNVVNGTEEFFLSRTNSSVSQCNQTMNQRDAYISLVVRDVEADDSRGTVEIIPTEPDDMVMDAGTYTAQTGCTIPGPESALSAGMVLLTLKSSLLS